MASQQAAQGKPQAFDCAVLLQRLDSILAARRREAARRRKQGGDELLIKPDGQNEQPRQQMT